MSIQMKRKEPAKTYDDFKLRKTFGLNGLYKINHLSKV